MTEDRQTGSETRVGRPGSGLNGLTIALVANTDWALYRFRLALIRELVDQGAHVYAIATPGRFVSGLEEVGATFVPWTLGRRSLNPIQELLSLASLVRIYRQVKPAIAHHLTAKPNIYGPIAARLTNVPVVIASVAGLGYVFTENGVRTLLLRSVASVLYRFAFRLCGAVTFENRTDLTELQHAGALPAQRLHYIPGGSGVNVGFFDPRAVHESATSRLRQSLDLPASMPVVLMVARMLWHKGVREFVECARILKGQYEVSFLLAGPVDHGNSAAIAKETLLAWGTEGCVRYLGEREDVRELLSMADIVVLPSYREGLPVVLLEAAAMAKPIVTADVPGCRDVVESDTNGLLVSPRDPGALARAVETLLVSPELRHRFGQAARQKAVREFDQRKVVAQIIEIYYTLLQQRSPG